MEGPATLNIGHSQICGWSTTLNNGHSQICGWSTTLNNGHSQICGWSTTLNNGHSQICGWSTTLNNGHCQICGGTHHTKQWPLHFFPSKSKVYLNVVRGCQQYTVLANRPGEKRMEKDYRMNTVADFTKERHTRITIINLYEL